MTGHWTSYISDAQMLRLSAAIRQRHRLREHAYDIDPGMALARALTEPVSPLPAMVEYTGPCQTVPDG